MFQRYAHFTGQPYPVFSVDICSAPSVRAVVRVATSSQSIQVVEILPAEGEVSSLIPIALGLETARKKALHADRVTRWIGQLHDDSILCYNYQNASVWCFLVQIKAFGFFFNLSGIDQYVRKKKKEIASGSCSQMSSPWEWPTLDLVSSRATFNLSRLNRQLFSSSEPMH